MRPWVHADGDNQEPHSVYRAALVGRIFPVHLRIGLIAECLRDISAGSALDTVIALHDKAGVETGAAAH